MKRLVTIVLIISLSLFASYKSLAQWIQVLSNSGQFNKIFALNKDTVFAVGYDGQYGLLLKSVDGGLTWNQISLGITEELFDIYFPSSTVGYLCGSNGTLMKTVNCGESWVPCMSNTTLNLRCLSFSDNYSGLIGAAANGDKTSGSDTGMIIKTTDGGQNFTICKTLRKGIFVIKHFNSDTSLMIADGTITSNIIYRSFDGGLTWNQCYWNTYLPGIYNYHLSSASLFQNGFGYVSMCNSYILRTTNYGTSWDSLNTYFYYDMPTLEISFPSIEIGYSAVYSISHLAGFIFKTIDGGNAWHDQIMDYFSTIQMLNDTLGYAATIFGNVYKTINGGIFVGVPYSTDTTDFVQITPNPFSSSFRIYLSNSVKNKLKSDLTVLIYSMCGELVYKNKFSGNDNEVNGLNSLSQGIYFTVIITGSNILHTVKLIKL